MKELVLVGARRMMVVGVSPNVIEKGGTITVDDEIATKLLEREIVDVAGNRHKIWAVAGSSEAAVDEDAAESTDEVHTKLRRGQKPQAPKKTSSRRAKKTAE